MILKTYLSPRSKMKTMNQLAISLFQYSYGIINWPQEEGNKLYIKTRNLLTIHKMLYKSQCIPRMYLSRKGGSDGLMELYQVHRAMIVVRCNMISNPLDNFTPGGTCPRISLPPPWITCPPMAKNRFILKIYTSRCSCSSHTIFYPFSIFLYMYSIPLGGGVVQGG